MFTATPLIPVRNSSRMPREWHFPLSLVMAAALLVSLFGLMIVPAFEDVIPRASWGPWASAFGAVHEFTLFGLLPTLVAAVLAGILWSRGRSVPNSWANPMAIVGMGVLAAAFSMIVLGIHALQSEVQHGLGLITAM